ncbi:MAG: DUF6398 domain-containing protein [bacterium]
MEDVRILLQEFAKTHLTPELTDYVLRLWDQIGGKWNYVITGGRPEVWASATVYVIARLNFLFDWQSKTFLAPDTICNFFGTRKNTISAKATEIERVCRIGMGQDGLCIPDIADSLFLVQLPNGLILTRRQAKGMGFI